MNHRLTNWFLTLIGAAMIAGMCACSSSERLNKSILEHVPAESKIVALFNLKNIALQSGCTIEADGRIVPTEGVNYLFEHADVSSQTLLNILFISAPYINDELLGLYQATESDDRVVIMEVRETEAFEQLMAKTSTASTSTGDYKIYAFPECAVVTCADKAWVSRNAQTIIDTEESMGENHFAAFNPVKEYLLTEPHDLEVMVNNKDNVKSELQYVLTLADFKNGGIYAESTFMDNEGTIFTFDNVVHSVDRDLLQFLPSSSQFLFAMGEVADWSKIFEAIETTAPQKLMSDYGTAYMMAKSYLSSIDGTTLLAMAPVAGSQALKEVSLDTWQLLFLTHMPQDETNDLISMANSLFAMQGLKTRETGEGRMAVKIGNNEVQYGTVNGYLFASNYDIMEGGNDDMGPSYEGKRIVAELLIPYGSETMKALNLPWGVDLNLSLSRSHLITMLRLPGSNGPVLKEVINEFASLQDIRNSMGKK